MAQAPPDWVPDNIISACCKCKNEFSLLNRKHHCRGCGLIFCGGCSSKTISLPTKGLNSNQRVCDYCFQYETQRAAFETVHCRLLTSGAVFQKHGRSGSPHARFVQLSEDRTRVMWRPLDRSNESDIQYLLLRDIQMIKKGKQTAVFERTAGDGTDDMCFSLVTADRSLDLQALTSQQRNDWVNALHETLTHLNLTPPDQIRTKFLQQLEQTQKEERDQEELARQYEEKERAKAERQQKVQTLRAKYRDLQS
eukprot:TRINITY_DN174_c0_g2_i1.p1 TRINITY_DN174_c0_g2~~TRINITY_DN174_c0_g2_i1.p1  ORF type:complete len:252 (-),score=23.71 TRINITY_DN174_c0_g2_i1:42-797(-)